MTSTGLVHQLLEDDQDWSDNPDENPVKLPDQFYIMKPASEKFHFYGKHWFWAGGRGEAGGGAWSMGKHMATVHSREEADRIVARFAHQGAFIRVK